MSRNPALLRPFQDCARPDFYMSRELQQASPESKIIVVNELLVRGNLPAATREVHQLMS